MVSAYYNEWEKYPAEWLCNLMAAGRITNGRVDQRSIKDVQGSDLVGYERVHLFAGIAGWELALELAGWPRDLPVWTGSCPCQPFSTAGKGLGTNDERHLWPEMLRLIRECRPPFIFGEQVAAAQVIGHKGKGSKIPAGVQAAAPCAGLDSSCEVQGEGEGDTLQLGGVPGVDSGPDRRGNVRVERSPLQPGQWENLGQPLTRPHRAGVRVCVHEHSCGLPCCEQCSGRLGRGEDVRDCGGDPKQAAQLLQQSVRAVRAKLDEVAGGYWFSTLCADLEQEGYTVGACVLPAAGVGAPHIRQRLWWGAVRLDDSAGSRCNGTERGAEGETRDEARVRVSDAGCPTDRLAYRLSAGLEGRSGERGDDGAECAPVERGGGARLDGLGHSPSLGQRGGPPDGSRLAAEVPGARLEVTRGWMGDAAGSGLQDGTRREVPGPGAHEEPERSGVPDVGGNRANPWADPAWLPCSDGKARPTQPDLFPLAHGVPGRVGKLRAAGNAIVPQVAATFVKSFLDSTQARR